MDKKPRPKRITHLRKGQTPRPPRKKYDWPAEKTAFFNSHYLEVKSFFENTQGIYNAHICHKTAGWGMEKEAWRMEQSEKIIKKIGEDRANAARAALSKILKIAIDDVDLMERAGVSRTGEPITALWRLIRTEAGLPSSITKQENIDLNELDEARALLDDKLKDESKPIPNTAKRNKLLSKQKIPGKSKPG